MEFIFITMKLLKRLSRPVSGPPLTPRCLGPEAQGVAARPSVLTHPASGHSRRHPRAFVPWLSTHHASLPLSQLSWVRIKHPQRRQKTGHGKALGKEPCLTHLLPRLLRAGSEMLMEASGVSETCPVKSGRPRGCWPRPSPAVQEGPCRMGKHWPQHPWAPRGTGCAGHSTLGSAHTPRGHARAVSGMTQGSQPPPLSLGSPRSCLTCLAHPSDARGRLSQRAEGSHHETEGL